MHVTRVLRSHLGDIDLQHDGQLVLDAMVRQVLLEVVGQVFASVVSAQHLIFSEPELELY